MPTTTVSVTAFRHHILSLSSSNSKTVVVTDDDITPPTILLSGSTGTESHGLTQEFSWSTADADSGLSSVKISVTRDGSTIFTSTDANGTFNFDSYGLGT